MVEIWNWFWSMPTELKGPLILAGLAGIEYWYWYVWRGHK